MRPRRSSPPQPLTARSARPLIIARERVQSDLRNPSRGPTSTCFLCRSFAQTCQGWGGLAEIEVKFDELTRFCRATGATPNSKTLLDFTVKKSHQESYRPQVAAIRRLAASGAMNFRRG